MAIRRDSLVHVAAVGSYGSVFGIDERGVCEVGLIDPNADDYSLKVPLSSLVEIEPIQPGQIGRLDGQLALFHLRIRHGVELQCAFQLFVGRSEEELMELWFARGIQAPRKLLDLDEGHETALMEALGELGLKAWEDGPDVTDDQTVSLDTWSWALEVIGSGRGFSSYGRGFAPEGMRRLCDLLKDWGVPIAWDDSDGEGGSPVAHE